MRKIKFVWHTLLVELLHLLAVHSALLGEEVPYVSVLFLDRRMSGTGMQVADVKLNSVVRERFRFRVTTNFVGNHFVYLVHPYNYKYIAHHNIAH